jgi:hypothetical protein
MQITQDMTELYRRAGYITIPNPFSEVQLAQLRAESNRLLQRFSF